MLFAIREHAWGNSENTNAFLVLFGSFSQKCFQNASFSSGFIRFWELEFPMSQKAVLPMLFLTFALALSALPRPPESRPCRKVRLRNKDAYRHCRGPAAGPPCSPWTSIEPSNIRWYCIKQVYRRCPGILVKVPRCRKLAYSNILTCLI